MEYILLDNFNGYINIICKNDFSGDPLIFDNLKDAEEALETECQDGQIIPLGVNIMQLLKDKI